MAARKKTAGKRAAKKAVDVKKNGRAKEEGVLRRPFLISVGAFALAEEQASSVIDSLIERGEKARKAGEKYMKKLEKNAPKAAKGSKAGKTSKKKAGAGEDLFGRALNWLNIPTRKEIDKLNKKVDALMKKVA